jgi:hypothetical protein
MTGKIQGKETMAFLTLRSKEFAGHTYSVMQI